MTTRALGALTLCLVATGCTVVAPRAAPREREIVVVAAISSPRVSVAHAEASADLLTQSVAALLFPPLARDAIRGAAQIMRSLAWSEALRAEAAPELQLQLADAVAGAAVPGVRLVRAAPADNGGCAAAAPPPRTETLHVAVLRVAFVAEAGPDAPLGVALAVRAVLRGPQGGCEERILFVATEKEMPFEAWVAEGRRELEAELRQQIASAGSRLLTEMVGDDRGREAAR
jgi:hypothetical protein